MTIAPSSFLVYILIWGKSKGRERNRVALSYQALAEATGLSKSATQGAIRRLVRRQLLAVKKAGPTATPEYSILTTLEALGQVLLSGAFPIEEPQIAESVSSDKNIDVRSLVTAPKRKKAASEDAALYRYVAA